VDSRIYSIEVMKSALSRSGFLKSYDCYVDEEAGRIVIRGKKEQTKKHKPINSRFDILDL